ncbi:hypothetical protein [uncultured Campylobacter sp.]|uniref:hypothetical protein n=1 Tax=uncultured Campylobacter sp. TaxID=218934 RepID=UPI002611F3C7|nr:hypothetical protein [uncultured Campylobacter sp.]
MIQAVIETVFDVFYLFTVSFIGVKMLKESKGNRQFVLYGVMAVTLGFGDAFHLLPRAWALCTTGLENYTFLLGIGKFVTSITMTLFYVLLYYVWKERYAIKENTKTAVEVWGLAILRILLCLFPQNRWLDANPPLSWGVYRNIPFLLLGLLIIVLFYRNAKQDKAFRYLWLTIVLSFVFYIPVVLFADQLPMIGMLMIPKTCAYVWTVLIGYCAMKEELK